MKLSKISLSPENNIPEPKSSSDDHEGRLRRQISSLQEEKKAVSNDKDKTAEEKKQEKQALQEKIQTLSSELRQYLIQKRQEEAGRKQEAAKEASRDAVEKKSDKDQNPDSAVYGDVESGVMISLSHTKGQLTGMKRVQSALERRHRAAGTEEEKADLQKRLNHVARNIGKKVTITEENVSKFKDSRKNKANTETGKISDQAFDWKSRSEMVPVQDDPAEIFRGNLAASRERFFNTVSIFIS